MQNSKRKKFYHYYASAMLSECDYAEARCTYSFEHLDI